MPLFLTRHDVETLLTMRGAINAVESALRELALGNGVAPPRMAIQVPGRGGMYWGMAAYIGGERGGLGFEVLSSYAENPAQHNLPRTIGQLMLSDPETGVPLAIMDATFLAVMREGAISAVATNYLARREVNEVTVFGTGRQAGTQLMGVCEVRQVNGAVVVDADPYARERFADQMSKALGMPIQPVEDVRAAVEMADVIITATSSRTPLFQGEWLSPGLHINAVGARTPDARELDTATVRRAKVVTDLTSACLAEAGDLSVPIQEGAIGEEHVHADLGLVVAGMRPGRENDQEITLFKSVGLPAADIATAVYVYNLARRLGVGQVVDL